MNQCEDSNSVCSTPTSCQRETGVCSWMALAMLVTQLPLLQDPVHQTIPRVMCAHVGFPSENPKSTSKLNVMGCAGVSHHLITDELSPILNSVLLELLMIIQASSSPLCPHPVSPQISKCPFLWKWRHCDTLYPSSTFHALNAFRPPPTPAL